eukprot:scaffold9130_cov124-Isochrysis_galbana.AAC.2
MHDAMTMPLKCVSPLSCNSIVSTALTPFSSRMGSAWPSRLQSRAGNVSPLLTTKQAHSELGWWGSERALERGEHRVALETLADVLGALVANTVGVKTVRAKQGGKAPRQPLLTTKRAHFAVAKNLRAGARVGCGRALEIGQSVVDLESLADVLGTLRTDVVVHKTARPNKEQTQSISLADNKASSFRL